MARLADVDRLYELLDEVANAVGGPRRLADCTGHMDWPDRGVYFFLAADERRGSGDSDSVGESRRVTRIGTHAVSAGSGTSLWSRLRTHRGATRGSYEGGGNHRGSVFRKRVGEAIIERDSLHDAYPYWGEGSTANRDRRSSELELERRVSDYVRDLPFLWLSVDDEPNADSPRAFIERNLIALVSNYRRESVDARAADWLGNHARSEYIRESGLWNVNHVDERYDPAVLDEFADRIESTHPP